MPIRIQSPSSIGIYKHCPRKYFYQYITKLETIPNIHQIRGNIAHDVLEDFFILPLDVNDINYEVRLKEHVQTLLLEKWKKYENALTKFNLAKAQEIFYFEETLMMLLNWLNLFLKKIKQTKIPFKEAFWKLTPKEKEKEYLSYKYNVRGILDAVEHIEEKIRIMDYKTSKGLDIEEYRLQLAIYSLLFYEKHGKLPDTAGIYFLKGNEETIKVDHELLELAKKEIAFIHEKTVSCKKTDYPKNTGPLCKWSTGKCDFYDTCMNDE